jgi:hypothetical protein
MNAQLSHTILPQIEDRITTLSHRLVVPGACVAALGISLHLPCSQLEGTDSATVYRVRKTTTAKVSRMNGLGGSKAGRVILHTVCLVRHPDRASWHWRGILREFAA